MLRYSGGYWVANDGVDTRALVDLVRHKNIPNTVRYTELAADRLNFRQAEVLSSHQRDKPHYGRPPSPVTVWAADHSDEEHAVTAFVEVARKKARRGDQADRD